MQLAWKSKVVEQEKYIPGIVIELVDSICKDTTDTQYMLIQKNLSKSQKRYTL